VPDCEYLRYGLFTARSFHPGKVNVTMMDGSVRSFSNSINRGLWRAIGTRAAGEISDSNHF
jgi:prepilin-type processing-associated H-X9-DG protein